MRRSLPGVFGALLFFLAALPAGAQFDLAAPRAFPMGESPRAISAADFDEDGRLDLVAANASGFLLRLHRDETLHEAVIVAVASVAPLSLAVGDIDADGHADVALSAFASVLAYFGDGAGGFSGPVTVHASAEPHPDLVLLDADGDGLLDVVFVSEGTKTLGLALQSAPSPRTFAAATPFTLESGDARLAVGNFDGDGVVDVAVAMASGQAVRLFRGDGAGGFASSALFPFNYDPSDIAAADFDRDGDDDAAVSFLSDGAIRILLGDPLSGFVTGTPVLTGQTYSRVEAGHTDGDANPDLLLGAYGIERLTGDGMGGFGPRESLALLFDISAFLARDFSGDGIPDIAAVSASRGIGAVFPGAGGGALVDAPRIQTPTPYGITSGDWNEDGHADLAVVGWLSALQYRVFLHFGDGAGGFLASGAAEIRRSPNHVTAGDFDGDGHLDLFVASISSDAVTQLVGSGGGFTDVGDLVAGLDPVASVMADADGDGAMDLAVANRASGTVSILFGDGTGAIAQTISLAAAGPPQSIVTGDFDRDGFADFAAPSSPGGGLRVFFGSAGRTFAETTFPLGAVGPGPSGVAIADVNGDGNADVVLADSSEASLRAFLGDGARGFSGAVISVSPQGAVHLALADVTGDGRLDALVSHGASGIFSVLPGEGSGAFARARSFETGAFGTGAAVADLDEDGRPDVALTSLSTGQTSLLFFRDTAVTRCLDGTVVGAAAGGRADVVFVNSRAGDFARRMSLARSEPFSLLVVRPPLAAFATRFVLYLWRGAPTTGTLRTLPAGTGAIAFPMPLRPGTPAPLVIWNNLGSTPLLGAPTLPSTPAPSFVLNRPQGLGVRGTFTIQGVIEDPAAPNGRASVTNGIVFEVK